MGSYFALQWLANLLVAAAALESNCVQSLIATQVLFLVNLFATYGLSVIGTNLLCHRYLVEKARVMVELYVNLRTVPHHHSSSPLSQACGFLGFSCADAPLCRIVGTLVLAMPTILRPSALKSWKDPFQSYAINCRSTIYSYQ